MAQIFVSPWAQYTDGSGNPGSGDKLYFYTVGTTTAITVYSDVGLTTPQANPVIADSAGQWPAVYLAVGQYKVVMKSSADVTIRTADPAGGVLDGVITPSTTNYSTGFIFGLTLTNNVADATNDIDIAAGAARDTADVYTMALAVGITKQLDVAWAVGTNAGGLDTGAVSSTVYNVWLIRRSDSGVVDVLFSLSATSPTMPTNYDQKARIGSFFRSVGVNKYPRSLSEKEATAWVAYTPTVSAGFGTATGISGVSRRVGDELEVEVRFTNGTVAASAATVTFGYNAGNNNVSYDTVVRYTAGFYKVGNGSDTGKFGLNVITNTVSAVAFSLASADWTTAANGNVVATTSGTFTATFSIKIAGW